MDSKKNPSSDLNDIFEMEENDFVEESEERAVISIESMAAEASEDGNPESEDSSQELDFAADSDIATEGEGDELSAYQSEEVEDIEQLTEEQMMSIIESLLFSTDKPLSVLTMKSAFAGTNIKAADIRAALKRLAEIYEQPERGVALEEVSGGFQLRTKKDNRTFLTRTVKARPFRLSGPALEVLAIVAYKQPCTKATVDDIRGVESGHLMRGLMDRGLMRFAGKSDLPGRPMLYETTKKFLETFSLRNLQELPTLNEIDQLIPEGITEEEIQKPKLSDVTEELSTEIGTTSYSQGEDELIDISAELKTIETTTAFFEEEKRRAKERRDRERAEEIRERLTVGEPVDDKDRRFLERYELEQQEKLQAAQQPSEQQATEEQPVEEKPVDEQPIEGQQVEEQQAAEDVANEGFAPNDPEPAAP